MIASTVKLVKLPDFLSGHQIIYIVTKSYEINYNLAKYRYLTIWYFNWYQHVYFDPGYNVSWKSQLNLMEIVKIIQINIEFHIFEVGKNPQFIMNMSSCFKKIFELY